MSYLGSKIIKFLDYNYADFRWVVVRRFSLDSTLKERDVLSAVVAHPYYRDDYYSPLDVLPSGSGEVHGPYMASSISFGSFVREGVTDAVSKILTWARQDGPLSAELEGILDKDILTNFSAGRSIFRLDISSIELESPPVVSRLSGFVEYVVFDKSSRNLELIVCSDD
ncbi:hypothetical protein FHU41_000457 [Psychromicrobium silvestre]|uniref:Uncharacterized protein n=1 Tax=Psychromicrobium silvestre TaxID=1645614 RepID=A0A7Y9S5U2_9MICC|nr:hypothetical protein [Psychromicrobium silvestre]NYE94236.1 hypothetical protein [Psychromicrobium silvestre]